MKKSHLYGLAFTTAALSAFACGTSDNKVKPAAQGQRGESCEARNDCEPGLACVRNVCTLNDFPITVTAKQCTLVQCSAQADCCTNFTPPTACPTYQTECNSGITTSCSFYNQYCVCQEDCVDSQCQFINSCTTVADCFGNFNACVGNRCVECQDDTDCFTNETCDNGTCVAQCTSNDDCYLFNTCVNGACQETGCVSDRQCIGYTGSPLATCVNAECRVPCQNDAECGDLEACQGGTCVFIGCDTNDDCRYLLPQFNPNSGYSAVCE